MPYRTRVYVCFDATNDINYYNTLKMWKANDNIDFDLNNAHDLYPITKDSEGHIKRNLKKRLEHTKLLIVLVGEKTKFHHLYVTWELDVAMEMDIPIAVVNLDGSVGYIVTTCPTVLRDKTVVHVPFKKDYIIHVMNYWPQHYIEDKKAGKINRIYRL